MDDRRTKLKHIILILLGSLILSFGIYNLNYQNNITEGGVLGVLLLLKNLHPGTKARSRGGAAGRSTRAGGTPSGRRAWAVPGWAASGPPPSTGAAPSRAPKAPHTSWAGRSRETLVRKTYKLRGLNWET